MSALETLQMAERETRPAEPLLADVFRVAAMNVWAYGPPCEGECDDITCEYVRPILAFAHLLTTP